MGLKPHRIVGPGRLRVQVDRERCQGHARCVAVASELFQLDAFGNANEINDGTVLLDLEITPGRAATRPPRRSGTNIRHNTALQQLAETLAGANTVRRQLAGSATSVTTSSKSLA